MYKITSYIKRLAYFPFAIFKGLIELTNEKARDIENRKRFPFAIIEKGVNISQDSIIGEHSRICHNVTFNHSQIGKYSYINFDSFVQHTFIGNYCSIAHGVKIGLGAHPTDQFSTSPLFYRNRNPFAIKINELPYSFLENKIINIGHDVWVGANAIIMDGVTIGNGAIVAAGAVVTKDIPAYAIVGGIPSKIIRYRFDHQRINQLEKSQWWYFKPNEILKIIPQ